MSRHALLRVTCALVFTCALLFAGCGAPQSKAPESSSASATDTDKAAAPDIEIREIRPGVWMHTSYHTFPDGLQLPSGRVIFHVPSNGLIVREGDHLLLVDPAWGDSATVALLKRIEREIGLPVRRAISTHSHGDRLAGVDVLERRGIDVWMHPMTKKLAAEQGAPVPEADTLAGLRAPGSAVRIGSVEVFYPGPGHAPDNLMVWVPGQRVLFGGCAVRAASMTDLGNTEDADLASWQEAIRRAQAQYPEAEVVVPGHWAVGGRELLRHTLRLFEE